MKKASIGIVGKYLMLAVVLAIFTATPVVMSPLSGVATAVNVPPKSQQDCKPGESFTKKTNPYKCVPSQSAINPGSLPDVPATPGKIRDIKDIVFAIIGGLVLLILTVSGLRYVTSAGDPQKAATARNGIIFALVGLAVALAADAIASYVVNNL